MKNISKKSSNTGAEILVDTMIKHGVKYIFCVPGASIDPILNVLADKGPKVILCHHESCAGYMAAAWGKITGEPGVVMVTAGPGVSNVTTALATALSERAPLIAITGQVGKAVNFKPTHQMLRSDVLFDPITKWSIEIDDVNAIPSIFAESFRLAKEANSGPTHIAISADLSLQTCSTMPISGVKQLSSKIADKGSIAHAAQLINNAKKPILLLGGSGSTAAIAPVLHKFVAKTEIPVVCTFEGAGTISRLLERHFMGRLGLFPNHPAYELLNASDLVITAGYNIAELDPAIWGKNAARRKIIHIDETNALIEINYQPDITIIGDIAKNLQQLVPLVKKGKYQHIRLQNKIRHQIESILHDKNIPHSFPIHPLRIISDLKKVVTDDNTIISDVGSHQYWMAKYFYRYRPKYFLTSMGFQTMGISLPFAIAACLARPKHKVFSIAGDGAFLMCSMELATAVRLKLPVAQLVWQDGTFNLVKIQQEKKYHRSFAADFAKDIDFAKYAESLGAAGFNIKKTDELLPALKEALTITGPVLINIPVDYSDNAKIVSPETEVW